MCKMYCFGEIEDRPIRRKRVIFTSIIQLKLCLDKVPQYVLDEALFCFRIPSKAQLLSTVNCGDLDLGDCKHSEMGYPEEHHPVDLDLDSDLVDVLRSKYEQNLLLLVDDGSSWNELSDDLQRIADPWYVGYDDSRCYDALRLDANQWGDDGAVYKHEVTREDIVHELHSVALKYAPSMEILWRSNPSLIPMRSWDAEQYRVENGFNADYIRAHGAPKICKSQLIAHITQETATSSDSTVMTFLQSDERRDFSVTLEDGDNLVVFSDYNSGNELSQFSSPSMSGNGVKESGMNLMVPQISVPLFPNIDSLLPARSLPNVPVDGDSVHQLQFQRGAFPIKLS